MKVKIICFISILALLLLFAGVGSAKSVYYPAKGNGTGVLDIYTNPAVCSAQGFTVPCARYDEGSLRVDMDKDSVRYQVQNNLGEWRWIQFNIPNPNNVIPSIDKPSKSLIWSNIYVNNTNLSYQMQAHGIKLNIWGNGVPPSNYFNFAYLLSTNVTYRMQGEEILFMDTLTGEPLWLVQYPSMHVNNTNVPLAFKRDGNKISIHASDLFNNSDYDFAEGWNLDPSVQSNNNIYIVDRQNLTQVSADINNASALQNLGGGVWLLNANLINNNTANTFYINESDCSWLKINSTTTYWYYLTSGKTEINNTKITSWNTASNDVSGASPRSAVYASGASSKMNISNSNCSYLGYNAANMYGVSYVSSSSNLISNNTFINNYRGIFLSSSSNNILTSNTGTSDTNYGIYLESSSNNNILTSNTGTSNTKYGILLYSSSNNTLTSNTGTSDTDIGIYLYYSSNNNILTSNTGTSNTNYGIYLQTSNNNNLTSNIANTNSTTATVGDFGIRASFANNTWINTDFTIKKNRKIYFYDSVSKLNMSQGNNIFVSTQVIVTPSAATTTNRSILSWTATNLSWTNTWTVARQIWFNVSGLTPNTNYQVWNGSVIDYNLTTDANGVLTPFTINFTTTLKTVKIESTEEDTTPPWSITNLTNTTYATTYINWSWTNPSDSDFAGVMVFKNGSFVTNTSESWINFTSLTAETLYTISTHTYDTIGNINNTWVNESAITDTGEIANYTISGYVNDSLGNLLSGVSVSDNQSIDSTSTVDGYYELLQLYQNGSYNLTFSKTSYTTNYLEVEVAGSNITNQNITLQTNSIYPGGDWYITSHIYVQEDITIDSGAKIGIASGASLAIAPEYHRWWQP